MKTVPSIVIGIVTTEVCSHTFDCFRVYAPLAVLTLVPNSRYHIFFSHSLAPSLARSPSRAGMNNEYRIHKILFEKILKLNLWHCRNDLHIFYPTPNTNIHSIVFILDLSRFMWRFCFFFFSSSPFTIFVFASLLSFNFSDLVMPHSSHRCICVTVCMLVCVCRQTSSP